MPLPPSFWRSPRLKSALPSEEIEIPAPPDRQQQTGSALTFLIPAVLTLSVMIAVGIATNQRAMLVLSVPMMMVGAVASVVTFYLQRRDAKRKALEREQKYKLLLQEYEDTLQTHQSVQADILRKKDPSPKDCLTMVAELRRGLWARSPADDDFLALRFGLAEIPSSVKVEVPKDRNPLDPDPLVQLAAQLGQKYKTISAMPICLALRQEGVVGLSGPRREALNTARALLLQLAVQHSPDEVKLVAFFPQSEAEEWAWLRWLPHVWSDDRKVRYMASNPESAAELLKAFDQFLNRRRDQVKDKHSSAPQTFSTNYVFLLADPSIVADDPVVQRLQAEGPTLGAFPIIMSERVRELPKACQQAIRVDSQRNSLIDVDSGIRQQFVPDAVPLSMAQDLARSMAPIRLRQQASEKDIPETLSLLDLLKAHTVEDLRLMERWKASETVRKSLSSPIGMRAGGESLLLDLHERVHGPNGLVAGMVGAGKSELLQTLVASLAINFHPHKMAFILVDYKGGGMADPFIGLPHTLGVITNLQQGSLSIRALTSFNVEAERRQRLFAQAEVNHIDDYQKKYYKGEVTEPLPYVLIVVDEFAEMKTEQPEVAKEFVRIARLGRALGFRLILAMQKPAGIVDGQIEANTRFRLCLRVAQTEDSQAMLKRPEAAYLSGVGRAYFQVGVNEVFDLFQVAWSGAPYDPSGAEREDPLEVIEIDWDGSRKSLWRPERARVEGGQTQLKAVADHIRETAQQAGIEGLSGPWLPPLQEGVVLDDVRPAEGWNGQGWDAVNGWMEPVVGVVDNPRQRYQGPFRVNLGKDGHLSLFGAPGYGATAFIQTLVTSLALTYSPADVNMYLMDFGGRLLRMFEPLPHVGAVVTADEPERVHRVLRHLLREIEVRKRVLGDAGVATLAEYRRGTGEALPAILVVIDKFATFMEAFEGADDTIAQIAREGGNLGVHLVITASSSSGIRFKVASNITMSLALYLAERGEYSSIVGRTEGLFPAPLPGRGLVKGNPVLEFQTALPAHGASDAERSAALKALFSDMARVWDGPRAFSIRRMPEIVPLSELVAPRTEWASAEVIADGGLAVPIGLTMADLEPFAVALRDGPSFIIAGPPQSGKSSLLCTWMLALAERYHPDCLQAFLLDSKRLGLGGLQALPHVRGYANHEDGADKVLDSLENVLKYRLSGERDASGVSAVPKAGARSARSGPIVLLVDDLFDGFDGALSSSAQSRLASLAKQGRRLGLHLIVAGCSSDLQSNSYGEPLKTLKEGQVGFMLGVADDSVFNLRLPYAERDKSLPIGEAYYTRRGHTQRIKVATVQIGDLPVKDWVQDLVQRNTATAAVRGS